MGYHVIPPINRRNKPTEVERNHEDHVSEAHYLGFPGVEAWLQHHLSLAEQEEEQAHLSTRQVQEQRVQEVGKGSWRQDYRQQAGREATPLEDAEHHQGLIIALVV